MRFVKSGVLFWAVAFLVSACGGGSSGPTPSCSSSGPTVPAGQGNGSGGNNVVTITVDGSTCDNAQYPGTGYNNEPCAEVTICDTGTTSNCQTIGDILVDTGSDGLRIFANAHDVSNNSLSVKLAQVTCSDSGQLAECLSYEDGSSDWGPVEYASVKLGAEPAVNMTIQMINANFSTPAGPCGGSSTPDVSAYYSGFNGIIGVGLLKQDCGSDCVTGTDVLQYYSCVGSNCSQATVDLNSQVSNPVSLLPVDNNGVIMEIGSVSPATGVTSVSGNMLLGIGTETNNQVAGTPVTYSAAFNNDLGAEAFVTQFTAYSSAQMPSFIDSGSNLYYIPPPSSPSMEDCGDINGSYYDSYFCPSTSQGYSATNFSVSGSPSGSVSFTVYNSYILLNTSNSVFNDIAASIGDGGLFDWGLPFFLGRVVYVGIDSTTSPLGTGPYWAY